MALVQVRRSDLSGAEIPPGTGARVRVIWFDENRPDMRADLTEDEVNELLPFATEVLERTSRSGRREP